MSETASLQLFMIRYKHKREVIDITGRGESGKDAFERYLGRMKSWGKDAKDYKFISARLVADADERAR